MTTVVIGGGASGMMCAIVAAQKGNKVILLEKNEKLGKKIYITGKGRCNLTNNVLPNDFLNNVTTNKKFLFSAINRFSPQDVIDFFEINGLKLKTERGNRVFPESDHASEVTKTLDKLLKKESVDVRLNTKVLNVDILGDNCFKVVTGNYSFICDSVVICTGGVSYPLTGSTGDGYVFAKRLGHTVTNLKPSLCGIELLGNDFIELQGLSLKNVSISLFVEDKKIYNDFGEMLFTHFGVSGPIVLSASCFLNKYIDKSAYICIDLKPALTDDVLDNRLLNEFSANNNKEITNVLTALLPKSMIKIFLRRCSISPVKKCSEITKEERKKMINVLKNFKFSVKGLRPIEEAIVTSGGIDVSEINPKTMESKLIKGLFFAGEVVDVDAFTGGFNMQIALSTGYLAGLNA